MDAGRADLEVVDAALGGRVQEAVPVAVVFRFAGTGSFVCEDLGEGENRVDVCASFHQDRCVGGPNPRCAHVAAEMLVGSVSGFGLQVMAVSGADDCVSTGGTD